MDNGGEAARQTTAGSADFGMADAVRGSEANIIGSGAFAGQLGAASWRQLGQVHVVLVVGPQLPGGVVPVHGNFGYSTAPQPRPGLGARRGMVLGDLLPGGGGGAGGAVYNWDYALLPGPGAGHGEVLVNPLPNGAGHGEAFVGLLPGIDDAAYDNYAYYALQARPDAGHGEVLVDLLPHGASHGEVFVGLLPGGVGAAHGELGAGYDGSGALADDLGATYNNRGMVSEHLRRLLPLVGIGASSVAINGLAVGPGSPSVAFQLFVLLLGGLFLIILHVLRE